MFIALIAGGTKGHLRPAELLAAELEKKGHQTLLIGKGIKKSYLQTSISYIEVPSSNQWKKLPFTLYGALQSAYHLRRVDLVISFGSYHSVSAMLAVRWILRRQYLLYEPNVSIGKAHRLFVKGALSICSPFSQPYKNAVCIHPLTGLKPAKKPPSSLLKVGDPLRILVFGGSQGAIWLNHFFLQAVEKLRLEKEVAIIHILGKHMDRAWAFKRYQEMGVTAEVYEYVPSMDEIYSRVDVAVARAVAGTLFELLSHEIPAVLIPYPYGEKHQKENAQFAHDLGCVEYFEQDSLTVERLISSIFQVVKKASFQKARRFLQQKRRSLIEIIEDLS